MTAVALATTQIDQQPVKERRISPRIRQAIDLLVTGRFGTQRAVAEHLKLSEEHLCRELRKPQIRVFMERRARETIANGTMRASARVIELLDAGSEHVSFEASKHVLAIAGIKPAAEAQVSVNIDIKAGYVIDLTDSVQQVNGNKAVSVIEHDVIK